jgi:predicted aconitase with swiveling domain
MSKASAPGKLILFGEHFVVYGLPAIATAIESRTIAEVEKADKGILTEKGHELEGKSFAGKVLVFPQGKGSTVGSYALYRLKKNNVSPLAMINKECEPIVAVGAIISDIPCVDKIDITQINTGDLIEIEDGKVTITKKAV